MRTRMASAAGALAIGLLAAACSSGSGTAAPSPSASHSPTPSASPPDQAGGQDIAGKLPPPTASGPTVELTSVTGIPVKVLTFGGSRLYIFDKDGNSQSRCTGKCTIAWTPYSPSRMPLAKGGVKQGLLGAIQRPDGPVQLTYNGHPLYDLFGESPYGPPKGEGIQAYGGTWYLVDAGGNPVKAG